MRIKTLFGTILRSTFDASGGNGPLECYYACMFSSYYNHLDVQPSRSTVQAILRGESLPPRKLLQFYWDAANPRCPGRLKEDLTALHYSCFVGATQCTKLREALDVFLEEFPSGDAEDLRQLVDPGDVIQLWTCLTWYALCGDYCG